jgi:hypothetical protein
LGSSSVAVIELDPPSTHRSPPPAIAGAPMPSLGAALSTIEIESLPSPGAPPMPTLVARAASEHGFDAVTELSEDDLEEVSSIDAGALEAIYQRALASIPAPAAPSAGRDGTDPQARSTEASLVLAEPEETDPRATIVEPDLARDEPVFALQSRNAELPTAAAAPPIVDTSALRDAHRALMARDWTGLDRVLGTPDLDFPEATRLRLRALVALGRGDTIASMGYAIRARESANDDGQKARAALTFAVALEAAGAREDALVEAFDALGIARAVEPGGRGDKACVRVIERLLP